MKTLKRTQNWKLVAITLLLVAIIIATMLGASSIDLVNAEGHLSLVADLSIPDSYTNNAILPGTYSSYTDREGIDLVDNCPFLNVIINNI